VTDACSTAFVTTSETSRQASCACPSSISHAASVLAARRRASDTMIGSAGKVCSRDARSNGAELTTSIAMSSSMLPGTACSAACATALATPVLASSAPSAAVRTASASMSKTSDSV
jgi:hypothetical protein